MSPASYLTAPPRGANGRIPKARLRSVHALVDVDRDRLLRRRLRHRRRRRSRGHPTDARAAVPRRGDDGRVRGVDGQGRGARAARHDRRGEPRAARGALRPPGPLARKARRSHLGPPRRHQGPDELPERAAQVTRVGVVDLGTNSTRLLVAEVENGTVRELERRLEITRLGEGVDERRQLLPQAIARVRNVLADYREAFLGEVEWSYGFRTQLLSGDEEALLTFRGVSAGRSVLDGTLVVDVGGGSTELIVGGSDGVAFHESLDLGSGRLTERFLKSDPPSARELTECAGYVQSLLNERVPPGLQATRAIGVAGTITTLATIDPGVG